MSQALIKAVANCGQCIQYEAKGQLPPMQPIVCTEAMELVHIDYVGMEVTSSSKRETGGEECTGGHRPFHPVCPGICEQRIIQQGRLLECCTTTTFQYLASHSASSQIKVPNFVGTLLQLCAAYWVLRRFE